MGKKKHAKRTVYKRLEEEKHTNEPESQRKRSIERHHTNINKNCNDKIEDMAECKRKSSKRIEVESTNYENSKEDVKNNQTEDKIECKESLKVGFKTETIEDETDLNKNNTGSSKTKKSKKNSKDHFDGKKLQNKQEKSDTTNLATMSDEISENNLNCSENNVNKKNGLETNKKKRNRSNNKSYQIEKDNLDDHKINKNDYYVLDETITSTISYLEEIDEDLFKLPKETSLAHCVAVDLRMGAGIAVQFKRIFGGVGKLVDQNLKVGDVGIVNRHGQNAFYLITKKYSSGKPNMSTMEMALKSLLKEMKKRNLNKLGIPKIGCGLDGLDWSEVKLLIENIFNGSRIHISVCVPSEIMECKSPKPLKVMITSKNLWEMEEKTDRIIFIDLENISNDIWTKDIIDKVNSTYPFKEILKIDMKSKKIYPGKILHYKINNENIFCAFYTNKKTKYSSIENAFKNIFKLMKDYMYLAIQSGPIESGENFEHISKIILIFRAIQKSSELWLCGDNTQTNDQSYDLYCKAIRGSMNCSSIYISPNQINCNSPKQMNYYLPKQLNYMSPNYMNFKRDYNTEKEIGSQNKKELFQIQLRNEENKIPDFKDNYNNCYRNRARKISIENQERGLLLYKLDKNEHNLQSSSSSEN